jgi:hypothetical protein
MVVPVEHRIQVRQYFERVEIIANKIRSAMAKSPVLGLTIAEKDTEILLLANKQAAEELGFSYHPWPFSDTEPTHYEEIGEQNG